MKKIIFPTIFLFVTLIGPGGSFAGDDFQTWNQVSLKMVDSENVDLITFADARFNDDSSDLKLFFVSERLVFDYFKNLRLGLNYTYLKNETSSGVDTHHRAEVEANPHWKVGDWLKITNRNRYEFRWIEAKGSHNPRFRHRWTFSFPLQNKGPLNAFYFNTEFFYDVGEHEHNQQRSVPLGFQFKIDDKTSLKIYYMIQSVKGANDWSSNQVLGTTFSKTF